jgi:peptidoglycan lytic transglycosylase
LIQEKLSFRSIFANPPISKNMLSEENEIMSRCVSCHFGLTLAVALLLPIGGIARAEIASIYGGRDGLCGHRTANGERLNCSAMTAAHRTLPFGTNVRVCHSGCVTVRINDRGPWVRGRHIDLSPAAARAIGLYQTGHVTMAVGL